MEIGRDMDKAWRVEVRGVRGSAPMAYGGFLEYGGNTSCFAVKCGEDTVVFDAGSGLLELGRALREEGRKKVHILLGHLHIDHICGLFGFPLFLDRDAEIHLYGRAEGGLQSALTGLLGRPCWPLGPADYAARVVFHDVTVGSPFRLAGMEPESPLQSADAEPESPLCLTDIESESQLQSADTEPESPLQSADAGQESRVLTVHTMEGSHPGGCVYYRLDDGARSVAYCLDCEINDGVERVVAAFAKKASLLIWDANFTDEDLKRCPGWGHASWRQGIAVGKAAQAETVLMAHYAREYTDVILREQEAAAKRESGICRFAKEGMVIEL